MDGWMTRKQYFSHILGRWDGANKWLFEMEHRLRLERLPGTTRSINQCLTHWTFGTPEMECDTSWWQSMNLNFSMHLWALPPWRGYYQIAYLCWDRSGSFQVAVETADTAVECHGQQPHFTCLKLTDSIKSIGRVTASTVETIHLSSQ